MTVAIGTAVLIIALLCILLLFLIFPRFSEKADMELLRNDYAHRGLWDRESPENSLSAFAKAVRGGYGIELDVQRTKDGCPVIFHDDTLMRMCGVKGRISDYTYAELKHLRLKNSAEGIPTLAQVLRLVDGKIPLMLEIKGEAVDKRLCLTLTRMLDAYVGPFCIESFSPLILQWFKHHRPSYARGQLVTKVTKRERPDGTPLVRFLATNMLMNVMSRPDFISINQQNRHRLSFLICHRLLHTDGFLWSVTTKEELAAARKQGCYVIFEGIRPTRTGRK